MKAEAFKPTGTMKPATLVSMGGPPRPTRMGPSPASVIAPMGPGGAPISQKRESSFNPHGQPVRLAGTPSPLAQQPSAPAQPPSPSRKASFQPQGEQVRMAGQNQPAEQRVETVYRVSLRGRAPDGSEWVANYDAVFPSAGVEVGAPEVQPIS